MKASNALVLCAASLIARVAPAAVERVLVLDLAANGVEVALAKNLSGVLDLAIRQSLSGVTVMSQSELNTLLAVEKQRDLVGCDSAACLAELTGALGADHLVTGSVGKVGDVFILTLKLIDARAAKTVFQVSEEVRGSEVLLLEAMRQWGAHLVDPSRKAGLGFVDILGAGPLLVDGVAVGRAPLRDHALARGRHELTWAEDGTALELVVEPYATVRVAKPALEAKPAAAPSGAPLAGAPRLYVMEPALAGLPAALANTLASAAGQAVQEQGLVVLTHDEVKGLVANQADLSSLGADANAQALAVLARAVGARHVVALTASASGDDTVVHLRLIDSDNGAALSRQETKASAHGGDVVSAVKSAARLALAPLFAHLSGTLAVSVSEEGANLLVDGQQIGVTPLRALVQPGGFHLLTITKDGFIRHQETVRIEGGDVVARMVKLRPSLEFSQAYRARNGLYRKLAWATSILAVPLVAGAVALNLEKQTYDRETQRLGDEYNDLDPMQQTEDVRADYDNRMTSSRNTAQRYGELSVGVGVTGAAALVTGLYFWLFGDDPDRYAEFEAASP